MTRRSLLIVLGCAILSVAAVLAFGQSSARAATANVSVTDFTFTDGTSSSTITTIVAGDSVVWTWSGASAHSVTADDASFDDPPSPGAKMTGTFSHTFSTPGTYAYYCRIHGGPGGGGMSGTVIVQAPAATNTPVATNTTAADTSTPTATNTPAPTRTPGSATPTTTPDTATATAAASITASVATPTTAPPAATATRSGGAAGGATLPRTGSGGGSSRGRPWLGILLGMGGLGVIAGAVSLRRRA